VVVVEPEAEIVRRIFERFSSGDGIKAIAHRLNAEGAPPPRPRAQRDRRRPAWAPTAVREMLRNELYRGERIWNRSEWRKPRRGARKRVERPASEWLREHREEWRVVPETLWHRVQERIASRAGEMRRAAGTVQHVPRSERGGRARHMLTGLLRCEECGSGFHALGGSGRFGCSGRKFRGPATCSNAVSVPAAELEARVLGAIRDQILVPEHVLYLVAKAVDRLREQREGGDVVKLRDDLAKANAEVSRLVALAAEVPDVPELAARLKSVQRERTQITAELRGAEVLIPDPVELRELVEQRLDDLRASLDSDRVRDALHELFRSDRIKVRPDAEAGFRIGGIGWLRLPVNERAARVGEDFRAALQDGSGGALRPDLPVFAGTPQSASDRVGVVVALSSLRLRCFDWFRLFRVVSLQVLCLSQPDESNSHRCIDPKSAIPGTRGERLMHEFRGFACPTTPACRR
jgi:hypothetical protein